MRNTDDESRCSQFFRCDAHRGGQRLSRRDDEPGSDAQAVIDAKARFLQTGPYLVRIGPGSTTLGNVDVIRNGHPVSRKLFFVLWHVMPIHLYSTRLRCRWDFLSSMYCSCPTQIGRC